MPLYKVVRIGEGRCALFIQHKVHALLSSPYKSSGVMGPGPSFCYLRPQELDAADSLHCCVVDEGWCVTPPEVDDDLLGFVDIQGQVFGFAPLHRMLHLLFVGHDTILKDVVHYCQVIRKLHNGVSSGPGTAVWVFSVNSSGLRMSRCSGR